METLKEWQWSQTPGLLVWETNGSLFVSGTINWLLSFMHEKVNLTETLSSTPRIAPALMLSQVTATPPDTPCTKKN